ncbi:MAG: 50S ribosomal protein L10 [Bacteroidetes bacterium]|nr:50S ribosomal protein L10 [Bacteroidota bacterium]
MTRTQKAATVDQLVEKLEQTPTIYITNYSGLSVEQATELRSKFREVGVEYKVIKNTMLRLAMERIGGYDEVFDSLNGPTAVAFSEEPSAPGRVIKAYLSASKGELPELKAAHVEGAVYHADALEVLASLKSKDELIGEIISLLQSPITNVVGALQAQGSNIVGAIKTIAEKAEA